MLDCTERSVSAEGNTRMDTYEQISVRIMGVYRALDNADPMKRETWGTLAAIDRCLSELRKYKETGNDCYLSYAALHANEAEISYITN
jgi:hypothetical protein